MKEINLIQNTKLAGSEWKRTGSSFHAIFQEVNDKKETLFLGKNNEEKYRRYFASCKM